MKTVNQYKLSPAVQDAAVSLRESRETRKRVAAALTQAQSDLVIAEAAHAELVKQAASARADALTGSSLDIAPIDPPFSASRDNADLCRACIESLASKLSSADMAVASAQQRLEAVWAEWASEQMETLRIDYRAASAAFLDVVDRTLAVAATLGERNTILALRQVTFPVEIDNRIRLTERDGAWRNEWRKNDTCLELQAKMLALRREAFGDAVAETGCSISDAAFGVAPLQPALID